MNLSKNTKRIAFIVLIIGLMAAVFFTWNKTSETSYVAKIGDYEVSLSEYMVYFREQQLNFETVGGLDIWETKIYGEPTFSLAKQYALDSLAYIKIMASEAVKDNISLTSEEVSDYTEEAKNYYDGLSPKEKKHIDYNTALNAIKETALAQKYRKHLLSKAIKEGNAFDEYFDEYLIKNLSELNTSAEYIILEDTGPTMKTAELIREKSAGKNSFADAVKAYTDSEVFTAALSEIHIDDKDKLSLLRSEPLSVHPPIKRNGEIYIIKLIEVPSETELINLKNELNENQKLQAEEYVKTKYEKILSNMAITKNSTLWDEIKLIEK